LQVTATFQNHLSARTEETILKSVDLSSQIVSILFFLQRFLPVHSERQHKCNCQDR